MCAAVCAEPSTRHHSTRHYARPASNSHFCGPRLGPWGLGGVGTPLRHSRLTLQLCNALGATSVVKCESGRAMNGSYLTPDTHQRDLRATYMSDTPGRAVSTPHTGPQHADLRATYYERYIRAELSLPRTREPPSASRYRSDVPMTGRVGGTSLSVVCECVCLPKSQADATSAHATMLATRAYSCCCVNHVDMGLQTLWG